MRCALGHEVQKIATILSFVGKVERNLESDANEKFVIVLGYSEKAEPCGDYLGDGYGDPIFFRTLEEAAEYRGKTLPKKNTVIEVA